MKSAMCFIVLAPLLALPALGLNTGVTTVFEKEKERPVSGVITLLEDMLKQLEKEAEDDQEIYEKMACWCETNDKEKTKSIADAETRIEDLTTSISELTAGSSRLNTEIDLTNKEVKENQDALDKATAMREKQLAEFNAEEKDMLMSISALKAAITTLSDHQAASLLQSPQTHTSIVATLQHEMQQHQALLEGVLTRSERNTIASFVQAQDYFDAEPTFKQSYAPQSGEIFGILTTMKETFESNLAQTQKDELANQKSYEDLKAAKEAEIQAGITQVDDKKQELATTDEKLAQSKEDLVDTKATLNADEQFLLMLKEKCSMTDEEWEQRQKTRQLEMEAVSKATAVLSGDDAHDLFTKTFNPALLQKASSRNSDRRSEASKLLKTVASKLRSPRLATIATQVKLDAFEKVKQAIDDMVANLLKEKQDEIKKRDYCIGEFNTNKKETDAKNRTRLDKISKISTLETSIDDLTVTIDQLKKDIADMEAAMKKAGETREEENKEFKATVADQRATQKLLDAALNILKEFYDKAAAAALLQKQQQPAGPPPPPGFESYEKSAAAPGVMGMITKIINDAKAMEAETTRNEQEAQAAYEALVKETDATVDAKNKDVVDKTADKAKAETDLVQTKEEKEAVMLEMEQLSNYKAELHESCDFVLDNFDARQTARDQEVEALRQAKAILSGAKFQAFLQKNPRGA